MYKHILIPIDGSKLSQKAVKNGVALARTLGAKVTGFTAVPAYPIPSEAAAYSGKIMALDEYEKRMHKKARAILARVVRSAGAAGVPCDTAYVLDDRPDEAIAKAAAKHRCDLILMASHGRSGLSAVFKGSETRGVLAKTTVPTLVYR
jgi:nucleotide-binding universal stress UspA family protein